MMARPIKLQRCAKVVRTAVYDENIGRGSQPGVTNLRNTWRKRRSMANAYIPILARGSLRVPARVHWNSKLLR